MTGSWIDAYEYSGPTLASERWALISDIILAILVFILVVYCSLRAYREIKSRNYKSINLLIVSSSLFLYTCFNIYQQIGYSSERNFLNTARIGGNCKIFEGTLRSIRPKTGDGHMAFEIGAHLFQYDTHHFALHDQLCAPGGPQLCVGDLARICLHGGSEGEILRIEKWFGTVPSDSLSLPKTSFPRHARIPTMQPVSLPKTSFRRRAPIPVMQSTQNGP